MAMAAMFKLYLPKVSRGGRCQWEVEAAASSKSLDSMNKILHGKWSWHERKITVFRDLSLQEYTRLNNFLNGAKNKISYNESNRGCHVSSSL